MSLSDDTIRSTTSCTGVIFIEDLKCDGCARQYQVQVLVSAINSCKIIGAITCVIDIDRGQ
jgi:hypothetical protein